MFGAEGLVFVGLRTHKMGHENARHSTQIFASHLVEAAKACDGQLQSNGQVVLESPHLSRVGLADLWGKETRVFGQQSFMATSW